MIDYQKTQEAFSIIERLESLAATNGISEEVKEKTNAHISSLLDFVGEQIKTFKAAAAGIKLI